MTTSTVSALFRSMDVSPAAADAVQHRLRLLVPVEAAALDSLRKQPLLQVPPRAPEPPPETACPCSAPSERHAHTLHPNLWSGTRIVQRARHLRAMAATTSFSSPAADADEAGGWRGRRGPWLASPSNFGGRFKDRMTPPVVVLREVSSVAGRPVCRRASAPPPARCAAAGAAARPPPPPIVSFARVPLPHASAQTRAARAAARLAVRTVPGRVRVTARRSAALPEGTSVDGILETQARRRALLHG